ncbi:hypothetical protein EsH8_I_001091 [Colletotrichum jinshuiense]
MQFKISSAAFLAFAASVIAQNPNFDPIYKPTSNEKVNAGSVLSIEWDAPDAFKDVTVSISLIGGPVQDKQVPLLDIASGIANSAEKYSWTIPTTLGKDAFYGLVIKSEVNADDFQYSNPFHIIAGEGTSSGTTTVTSSVGTATVTLSAKTSSTGSVSAAASASTSSAESVIVNSTTALSTTAAPTAATQSGAAATTITSVTRASASGNATVSRTASTTIATVTGAAAGAQATAGVLAVLGGFAVAALL